jgi:hypothetical protein
LNKGEKMDTWTIGLILWIIFIIIPAHNQTTSYIKIVGILISALIMASTFDWIRTYEALDELMKSFYEWLLVKSYLNEGVNWLLIKTDGDRIQAKIYFTMILVIAMQPIILGSFWLLKRYKERIQ